MPIHIDDTIKLSYIPNRGNHDLGNVIIRYDCMYISSCGGGYLYFNLIAGKGYVRIINK